MKISEIEAVSPEDFAVFEDGMPYSYVIDRGCKKNAMEVEDFPKLYTADQMQEYAKECVREALKFLDNKILPIFENDERVVMQKIFEEDTKND